MRTALLLLVVAACGSSTSKPKDAAQDSKAFLDSPAVQDAPPPDASADIAVTLAGGANALRWDAATSTLYLTDNTADALVKWTAAGGLQTVATLPTESAGISLGDILELPDGTILIANFGFGTQGTVFSVAPGATTGTALTGLDATRRRIGMSQDSAGKLYTSYFVGGGGMMMPVGGVATLTIATGGVATETEISGASSTTPPGYKKVVGVAATPTKVYASDQTQKIIFQIATADDAVSQLATLTTSADLLVPMPNGDLLTGGGSTITRITQTGTVTSLPNTSFMSVRGMAYDETNHRLFVIDHSSTAGTSDVLHTIPLAN
jgi:hypothetical protein